MDSKYILEWMMKKVNGSAPVFIWGLSRNWIVLHNLLQYKLK